MMTLLKFTAAIVAVALILTASGISGAPLDDGAQLAPASQPQQADAPVAWGKTKDDMRLGLRMVGEVPLRFDVLVQNVGKQDAVLRLGTMLGNGQTQYPTAIKLIATNTAGKHVTFTVGPSYIGGRVDPLVVPLLAGATYTIPVSLDRYKPDLPFGNRLQAGEYRFTAGFEGKAVDEDSNNDLGGLKLMTYWTGQIETAPVKYVVPEAK